MKINRALIKRLLPKKLRRIISKIGRVLDEEFPSQWLTLETLKSHGFNPKYVIDVGAYEGVWARDFRRIFPEAKVLMFEPQPDKEPKLSELKNQNNHYFYSNALLGAKNGERVLFNIMESGSSCFAEKSDVPRKAIETNTHSLDTIVSSDEFIVCPRGMGEKPSPLGEDFQYACGSVGV